MSVPAMTEGEAVRELLAHLLNQVAWLSAFASGLQDHAPDAAHRLHRQSEMYMSEYNAVSERLGVETPPLGS